MAITQFNNVKITGIKTVIPESYVDIDDELFYFQNSEKKLKRAKKMMGYGRRYIADNQTTVTDLCCYAAENLLSEMNISKNSIDLLIFVNQKPDYREPNDACIAHGVLGLENACSTLALLSGCSGYIQGLLTAHAMISSGASKRCLLLAGDIASYGIEQSNRKSAQLFGDAVSATLLEATKSICQSTFITGTDGQNWDKIVNPFGGIRLPLGRDIFDLTVTDQQGNTWTPGQPLMQGDAVFNFTMHVIPELIGDTIKAADLHVDDIDLFALHQANKQIVETISEKAHLPPDKVPVETFTKYANNSISSVATVLCDQLEGKTAKIVLLCGFGIGLSWGACVVNFSAVYNGGIMIYSAPPDRPNRKEQIEYWFKYFKGEDH